MPLASPEAIAEKTRLAAGLAALHGGLSKNQLTTLVDFMVSAQETGGQADLKACSLVSAPSTRAGGSSHTSGSGGSSHGHSSSHGWWGSRYGGSPSRRDPDSVGSGGSGAENNSESSGNEDQAMAWRRMMLPPGSTGMTHGDKNQVTPWSQPMKVGMRARADNYMQELDSKANFELNQSAADLRDAIANWESCLQQSAGNGAEMPVLPAAMPMPMPGPPGAMLQGLAGQQARPLKADSQPNQMLQDVLCQVANSLPATDATAVVSALADSLAAALVRANSEVSREPQQSPQLLHTLQQMQQIQPSSQMQQMQQMPTIEAQLQQLQQLQQMQQMQPTSHTMTPWMRDNAALTTAASNAAQQAALAWQQQQASTVWQRELLLQQTEQALRSSMPTTSMTPMCGMQGVFGAGPPTQQVSYSTHPYYPNSAEFAQPQSLNTHAAPPGLDEQQYLSYTGGQGKMPPTAASIAGGEKGARRGQNGSDGRRNGVAAAQNQGGKNGGKGGKSGRNSQQQEGGGPGGRAATKNAKKEAKKLAADSSLRVNLEDLNNIDPDRIVLTRKINRLGFESAQALTAYFSQYGEVDRVLVAHCHSKSRTLHYRPSGLGFVVMCKAEDAQAALVGGPEVQILPTGGDVPVAINIQSFKRMETEEQDDKEVVTESL